MSNELARFVANGVSSIFKTSLLLSATRRRKISLNLNRYVIISQHGLSRCYELI